MKGRFRKKVRPTEHTEDTEWPRLAILMALTIWVNEPGRLKGLSLNHSARKHELSTSVLS